MNDFRARLTFLGTAGTRFVVISQRRASGGMWLSLPEGDFAIDPGPGALVQAVRLGLITRGRLSGVLLTHRHLDHSNDLNVMVEAMVTGNRAPNGLVALPVDGLSGPQPTLMAYLRPRLAVIHRWADGSLDLSPYGVRVSTILLRHHGVECRGLRFSGGHLADWGILSDTRYFRELADFYRGCHTVVADVTFPRRIQWIQHLGADDLPDFIARSGVRRLVMTHLGNQMLDDGPETVARSLCTNRCQVLAACDDLTIDLAGADETQRRSSP